jgi:Do/DeqQ family serine protease
MITTMKTHRILIPVISAIIGGLISIFVARILLPSEQPQTIVKYTNQTPAQLAAFTTSTGERSDFSFAAESTVHAVVHVKTSFMVENQGMSSGNPFFDYFFGPGFRMQPEPAMSSGSGVIISLDGYIITNNHVVDKAESIEVVLNDSRTFQAKVVGRDLSTDLAILKIEAANLPFLNFGNSDNLKIGEWVLAVGNPFNLTSTVTAGIVSAKARNINILNDQYAIESFIQTDAAVNPGNSGGALVNLNGELVGINTAIASRTGSFSGYSFAIPSSIAKKVSTDIIEFGEVQRAVLGVELGVLNSESAKKYNINELKGVIIGRVVQGGAAEEVGLKEGDVIIEVNGKAVNSPSQLQEEISRYRPNEKVELVINRNNNKKQFTAVLRNRKGGFEIVRSNEILNPLGADFKDVDSNLRRKLGINGGIQVVKVREGKLKQGGVREGFIITRVNRNPVNSVTDLAKTIDNISGAILVEGVYPNGTVAYYAIGM